MKNWQDKKKELKMSKGMPKEKKEETCCIKCGGDTKLLSRVLRHSKNNKICGYIIVCEADKDDVQDMGLRKREPQEEPKKEESKIITPGSKRGIIKHVGPSTFKRLKDNLLKKSG